MKLSKILLIAGVTYLACKNIDKILHAAKAIGLIKENAATGPIDVQHTSEYVQQ